MLRILFILSFLALGCEGKMGPAGPAGSGGAPGDAIPSYQALFRTGVLPLTGYAGVTVNGVDINSPNTAFPDSGAIRLAQSAYPTGLPSRVLVRFDISQYIPQNASITSALLQLSSTASTAFSGASVTVGVFNLSIPGMVDTGSCLWNVNATWERYEGSTYWVNCVGNGPHDFDRGYQYPQDPMDTVVIPAAASGLASTWAWNITPSVAQKWLDEPLKNNGVVVTSVNEWSETASGTIVFGTTASAIVERPMLTVNYYIP